MPSATRALRLVVLVLASLAIASSSAAQTREEPGSRHASFMAGGSFGDGDSALALSAAFGFQLAPRLTLDVELAYARKLDFTVDLCPPPRVCVVGGRFPVTGRTVALMPQLAFELLPRSRRVRAYALAGVGAAHVRQRYVLPPPLGGSGDTPTEFTRSNIAAALSYGGGVERQIAGRFAVGADVRGLHVLDEPAAADPFIIPSGTLSTLRVGSRIVWRF